MTPLIVLKSDFTPPLKIELENYSLEVLTPKHNKIDYQAWNSSRAQLHGIFGPRNNWPGAVSSLEQNLKDLENHRREFNENEAFTYTILSTDKELCLGCLYIRPAKAFSCRADFWLRNSHKHLESEFYEWLQDWLTNTWALSPAAYPGRSISWNEYYRTADEAANLNSF